MDEEHHRHSIRLKNYDYSAGGGYFITICAYNKKCLFGKIVGGEMILNKYGEIVKEELVRTPAMRHDVELDEYRIMPNHIHGIKNRRGTMHRAPTRGTKEKINTLPHALHRGIVAVLRPRAPLYRGE